MSTKCKVILVGEAGVGKTCIIKQYLDNSFDPEEIPTIAVQEVYKIKKQKINIFLFNQIFLLGTIQYFLVSLNS